MLWLGEEAWLREQDVSEAQVRQGAGREADEEVATMCAGLSLGRHKLKGVVLPGDVCGRAYFDNALFEEDFEVLRLL